MNAGQDHVSVQTRSTDRRLHAEERLADTGFRLHQAKLEALIGIRYDPDEYDQLVLEYRDARRRADALRRVTRLMQLVAPREAQTPVRSSVCAW